MKCSLPGIRRREWFAGGLGACDPGANPAVKTINRTSTGWIKWKLNYKLHAAKLIGMVNGRVELALITCIIVRFNKVVSPVGLARRALLSGRHNLVGSVGGARIRIQCWITWHAVMWSPCSGSESWWHDVAEILRDTPASEEKVCVAMVTSLSFGTITRSSLYRLSTNLSLRHSH